MFKLEAIEAGRVRLVGRLDAAEAEQASRAFAGLDGPIDADCSALEYISSAGISVLMVTNKRLHQKGHVFRLSAVQPRVRNVFVYSGLAPLLGIE
jgi:anti-sigma B factor antagonist